MIPAAPTSTAILAAKLEQKLGYMIRSFNSWWTKLDHKSCPDPDCRAVSLTILSSKYTLHQNWQCSDCLKPLDILSKYPSWVSKILLLMYSLRNLKNGKTISTFQLRDRSIWPATYEASPESLACNISTIRISWVKNNIIGNNWSEINIFYSLLTFSILPRSNPSKFFNVKYGGKVNLQEKSFVKLLIESKLTAPK